MYVNGTGFRQQLVRKRENRVLKEAEALVEQLLKEKGSFALWGAGNTGNHTRRFLERRTNGKLRPAYVVDNNPSLWGKDNIIGPEEFFSLKDCPAHLVVAVYVADQVVDQIRSFGYKGKVSCLNATTLYEEGDIWTPYEACFAELEETFWLLADEASKATLIGFLNYIRTLDDRYLEAVNGNSREKLMDASVLKPTQEEYFVDVGAFTGDTIDSFLNISDREYKGILALEPDKENFSALCRYVTSNQLDRIIVKQLAAGEEEGRQWFQSGMSESCRIGEYGTGETEVRRLDSMPEALDVTLLKVSSNGLDLSVLKGAEGLILSNGPKISTYASGSLLWEIPAYIKKLNPDYKIYYRHYGLGRQAMICYGVL